MLGWEPYGRSPELGPLYVRASGSHEPPGCASRARMKAFGVVFELQVMVEAAALARLDAAATRNEPFVFTCYARTTTSISVPIRSTQVRLELPRFCGLPPTPAWGDAPNRLFYFMGFGADGPKKRARYGVQPRSGKPKACINRIGTTIRMIWSSWKNLPIILRNSRWCNRARHPTGMSNHASPRRALRPWSTSHIT